MDNIYTIEETDLKIALDQVDNFKDKMEMFSSKHLNYSYNVKFNKELDKWFLTLPHGEFSKIVNLVLEQYVKEQGIDLTEFEEEMNYND